MEIPSSQSPKLPHASCMPGAPAPPRSARKVNFVRRINLQTLLEAVFQTDDRRLSFQGYINVVPQQYKVVKNSKISSKSYIVLCWNCTQFVVVRPLVLCFVKILSEGLERIWWFLHQRRTWSFPSLHYRLHLFRNVWSFYVKDPERSSSSKIYNTGNSTRHLAALQM